MTKKRFNWLNIGKAPEHEFGVYSIWSKNICIYVGLAKEQSIRVRLRQHYSGSHNDILDSWIKSSHPLWFHYESVENKKAIEAKERIRIKRFAPIANKILLKKENQYGQLTTSV